METLQAIHTRRSIRAYTDTPVSDAQVRDIVTAGMAAPSAGNEQPWQFVVIRDREKLAAISETRTYAEMVKDAQVAILVCADLEKLKHQEYWVQDCAAATENMLLAAHALGLGSVWIGIHPREKRVADFRTLIPLPDHIIPFSLLPVGYAGEEKSPAERFDPSRIHYEKWQGR